MCCRYYVRENDAELAKIAAAAERSPLMERLTPQEAGLFRGAGEIRPTNVVPAIATNRKGERAVFPMRWGFRLEGRSAPLINARAETAAEKQTFREAWTSHRCILPASWYYEWQHAPREDGRGTTTTRYSVRPRGSDTVWLCGLYRVEAGFPSFVILTAAPSPDVAFLHDRMPLMLPKEAVDAWIDPRVAPQSLLRHAVTALLAQK